MNLGVPVIHANLVLISIDILRALDFQNPHSLDSKGPLCTFTDTTVCAPQVLIFLEIWRVIIRVIAPSMTFL